MPFARLDASLREYAGRKAPTFAQCEGHVCAGSRCGCRHGRATVCGEPPERHCPETDGKARAHGNDPRVRIPSQSRSRSASRQGKDCDVSIIVAARCLLPFRRPSPSPSAPPQIAHVVTSDRGIESVARTARTTYVVTAAEIARDGDRTVADAIENVPGVDVVRYGAFGAAATVGIRGSSASQVLVLVDGCRSPAARSTTSISSNTPSRGRPHRSRRRRRLDAVRLGIDRRRDQHHHGRPAAAERSDDRHRLVRPARLSLFDAVSLVSRTYAANDYPVVDGPNRAERASRLDVVDGALRPLDRRDRPYAQRRHRRCVRRRPRRTRLLSRRRASKPTSIATCGSTQSTTARVRPPR